MESKIEIYSDGGARGNPGPGACAFVIKSGGKIIAQDSKYLGSVTNNFAEYSGVLLALNYILEKPISRSTSQAINFYMDSELVVRQLNGHYKVKNNSLRKINEEVKNLLVRINGNIIFENVPRIKNKDADGLVNQELDQKHEA